MLFQQLQSAFLSILTLAIVGYSSWVSSYAGPQDSFDPAGDSRPSIVAAPPTPPDMPAPGPLPDPSQPGGPTAPAAAEVVAPSKAGPTLDTTSAAGVVMEALTSPLEHSPESVDYLAEIGFGVEYGESTPVLHKWTEDVRVKVRGTPTSADMDALDQVVQDLNALITTINLQLTDRDANVEIYFLPEVQFTSIEPGYVPVNLGFFRVWWDGAGVIYRARILIASQGITQQERSHLIREELTQSLGLFQDSWRYSDSIFYQGWTDTNEYSALDRSAISLLYDSRLHPGMTQSEVWAVLGPLPAAICCAD